MAARFGNWLAIVVGGTGGTLAAVMSSAGAPAPAPVSATTQLHPVSQMSATVQAAARTPAASVVGSPPLSGASAEGAAPAAPQEASAAPAASAAPVASAISADLAPLPNRPEALLHAEMRCDQGKSESCIIAARSYESGSAGQTDPEKASKYRRIALTMWISHCDHNSAAACVTLAKLYRAGEGVPQSDRNADALIARARDLCRFTDVPACHELPAP